jgi:hypothetical protein
MNELICKKIKDEEECKQNPNCIFTKSNKCQKKSQKTQKIMPLEKIPSSLKVTSTSNNSPIIKIRKIPTKLILDPATSSSEKTMSSDLTLHPTTKQLDIDILSHKTKKTSFQTVAKTLKHNPCHDLVEIKERMKKTRREYDEVVQACENYNHEDFINRYFNKETFTHKDLLQCLMEYYKEQRQIDDSLVITFQEFINKFPRDKKVGKINFKKQHVFEAICRLLLLYNYDDGELGRDKTFYSSLEDIIKNNSSTINKTIINTDINIGSKGGLVDILFKINLPNIDEEEKKEDDKQNKKWACESSIEDSIKSNLSTEKDTYIMIQNKYYDAEKSNLGDYDVTRMYTLADLNKKNSNKINGTTNIVLMVNNEDALSQKLKMAKQQYPGLIYNIYGISNKLDTWFQSMLYELKNSDDINMFLENKGDIPHLKPSLKPRFHQLLITRTTMEYLKEGYKKFIWGAVPRSGKSFMIGGLISLRNIKHNIDNNIVLILGAKTETQGQFIKDLFKKFEDFKDYTIICPGIYEKEGEKNIYLFSQEYLKDKIDFTTIKDSNEIDQSKTHFKEDEFKFKKLLNCDKKIDLYFDEIHKGGSTDRSENIIYAFKNICKDIRDEHYSIIDLFVMVTATFAKPSIKYDENFIDGKPNSVIIQWSYNDQQNMKDITNDTKKHMMINSREGIESRVMRDLFDEYKDIYGYPYLSVLSNEYKKHPELVLISPFLLPSNSSSNNVLTNTDDVRHIFENLKCDACVSGKDIKYYKNPTNIFKQEGPVNDLLDYIPDSIYNYFQSELNYPISTPHSELWFLPDKDLYGENDCKDICNEVKIDDNGDLEVKLTKTGTEKPKGIPNIEPLTRGLALKITNNPKFNRYNVFIVHNTKLTYLKTVKKGSDLFDEERVKLFETGKGENKDSLADQIRKFEIETKNKGRSLIILTGAKLRLGVSLPCVDIAFNFDNISSVDNNYQTMFRVLTEREKPELKKYGYYLDFNKSRAITFLYEYNKNYGTVRKSSDIKENVEALQSLLFSFNYNGLNLQKLDTKDELGIYNQLISELNTRDGLGLNEQSYVKYWSQQKNIMSLIKTSLALTGNMNILSRLSKLLDANSLHQLPNPNISVVLKEGGPRGEISKYEGKQKLSSTQTSSIEDDEEEENYSEIINKIASELPTIVVLLALFSNETNNNCDTLLDCLEISRRQISSFTELCNCSNVNRANVIDCYLNSPGNSIYNNVNYRYSQEHLVKILETIIEILNNPENELVLTNLDFIFNNIKKIMPSTSKLIYGMSLIDIEEKIKQYLLARSDETAKFGEVFTPKTLIIEMLNKLPNYVWENPELTWLDPANGIGNFPMIIYNRLMGREEGFKGLPSRYVNKDKNIEYSTEMGKSNHILRKMLFMVEINSKNVKISKKIFGQTANICCAHFLEEEDKWKSEFKKSKFDIIIGNPPFNENKTQDDEENEPKKIKGITGKRIPPPREGGKNKLSEKFTTNCLSFLQDNGYLLFITPDNLLTGNTGSSYKEIIKLNTLFININNIQKRYFPKIGQTMCYILVKKSQKINELKTIIVNQNGEELRIILENRSVNPIRKWTAKTELLLKKYLIPNENNAVYNRGTKELDYTGGKYEVIYTPNKNLHTDNIALAPGIGVKKMVLFESISESEGKLDMIGNYGVGPHTMYIPFETNTEGKILQNFFKSTDYKDLLNSILTSQYLKTSIIKHLNLKKIFEQPNLKITSAITNFFTRKNINSKKGGNSKKKYTRKYKN